MWTEKYRPRSIRDLIGNSGVIDNLYNWLKDWDDVVMRGNKKQIKATGRFNWADAPKLNAAAALMSGPPGIGKTSSARIICASLGYEVIEMNASDTRNKSAIENRVKDLSQTKSLKYFSEAGIKKYEANTNPLASAIGGLATKKSVIIMDEVDGLGAGDRGGVAALCKVIKDTKTPIICICNDIQNRKLMSLKTHCYEMKFQRPNLGNIRDFVLRIVKQEGMDYINADIADRLIDSAGCDIRQVVNILQMWS
jgi:replication factor C subunit 1